MTRKNLGFITHNHYHSLIYSWQIYKNINPFLPNVPFWYPWKHQKTFGFLMFSRWSKRNIEKKRVKNRLAFTTVYFRAKRIKVNLNLKTWTEDALVCEHVPQLFRPSVIMRKSTGSFFCHAFLQYYQKCWEDLWCLYRLF